MLNKLKTLKTITFRRLEAFTLSEVLITLVIIGVIAAITIPAVIANYTEQEKYSRVKKAYSTLANAMTRLRADGGDGIFEVSDSDINSTKSWFDNYMKPYIVTTKVCYDTAGCWNKGNTIKLNGQTESYNRSGTCIGSACITAVLNDGTLININVNSGSDAMSLAKTNVTSANSVFVHFDINGEKKPNQIGKDIFVTIFTENGLVPAYSNATHAQIEADCSSTGSGYSCIQKYLKQNSDRK